MIRTSSGLFHRGSLSGCGPCTEILAKINALFTHNGADNSILEQVLLDFVDEEGDDEINGNVLNPGPLQELKEARAIC